MDIRRVKKIFKKDALDLLRTRGRVIALFLFPMMMIFFFGVGFSGQVSGIDTLVVTENQNATDTIAFQNAMISSGENSDLFEVHVNSELGLIEAKELMEKGEYDAVVYVPESFSIKNLESGKISVLVDPTKSQQVRASVMEGVKNIADRLQGGLPPVKASEQYGDLDYIDFLAPAIIVLTIFFGAAQGTGRALAGEKEEGTLDRLAMTPASANDIIAGKTTFAIATQLIRSVIIILFISLLFGVAMNGSWALVGIIVLLMTIASVGIGLVLSAIAENETTYSEISMMVILPAMFVSGVFFPISAMPNLVQYIAYLYPLSYANNAIRRVMLLGSGIGGIAQNLLILAIFAIGLYFLGVWLFNRTARR